ncbi:eukaryotic initiation factor 4A-like [Elaeis guineensis]|uniref:Eukaryotic initiation factor 4A-13-like n=1 Tax=Elaeis guineensis var. tenera TaxID=51953 RepID=A0A6J0PK69_ELAGV|nr:eukaryotic initiation factor 4A-13-like [Elaeis guineensis]
MTADVFDKRSMSTSNVNILCLLFELYRKAQVFLHHAMKFTKVDSMDLQVGLLRGIYAYAKGNCSLLQKPLMFSSKLILELEKLQLFVLESCSGLIVCQAMVLAPTQELAQQTERP